MIYTDTDPDVLEHDDDLDAEMYTYEKRQVYRGRYDRRYTTLELDVHWLYDENSKRVGLVEYESGDFNKFSVLWYYDNPYSTLLQDPSWKTTGKTLWSMLTEEAYQDCLEDDFKSVIEKSLYSPYRLVFPSMNVQGPLRDIKKYVSLSNDAVEKASEQLRLKRTKPVNNNVQTLDMCIVKN